MTGWVVVLAACAACFAVKLTGHLVPHQVLERPRVTRVAALVTVALLAALLAVQTLVHAGRPGLDARVPAVAVAALLLWRRAGFATVVVVAALVAAGLRAVIPQ